MSCSLYRCATLAGVFGILESLSGLGWNIWLLVTLKGVERSGKRNVTETSTSQLIEGLRTIPDPTDVYIIVATSTTFHSLWLLSSVGILIGNRVGSRSLLSQWVLVTLIIVTTDVLAAIYFTLRLGAALKNDTIFNNLVPALLAILFSRGCIVLVFLNVFLMHFVCQRCCQIAARAYCRKQEYIVQTPVSELHPQVVRHFVIGDTLQNQTVSFREPVFCLESKPADEEKNNVDEDEARTTM